MKKYITGLVVGKFCPLHAGHIALIKKAIHTCENVVILSYTSENFENCSASNRKAWLEDAFSSYANVTIRVLEPEDLGTLKDSSPGFLHRIFCAKYLLDELETTVQAVFTSEDYGDELANDLSMHFEQHIGTLPNSVTHECFNKDRTIHSISGTLLREKDNLLLRRQFLSGYVDSFFKERILILGGESSGKSTLVKYLATAMGTGCVEEFGRQFYNYRNGKLAYEDMILIANQQIKLEHITGANVAKYLICDTSALTTSFYSTMMFGRSSSALSKLAEESFSRYSKVYICSPDIPFDQDGTRRDKEFRTMGHNFYVRELSDRGVPFKIVEGTVGERADFIMKDLISSV